jgi:hypothetical protein
MEIQPRQPKRHGPGPGELDALPVQEGAHY